MNTTWRLSIESNSWRVPHGISSVNTISRLSSEILIWTEYRVEQPLKWNYETAVNSKYLLLSSTKASDSKIENCVKKILCYQSHGSILQVDRLYTSILLFEIIFPFFLYFSLYIYVCTVLIQNSASLKTWNLSRFHEKITPPDNKTQLQPLFPFFFVKLCKKLWL